MTPHLDEMWHKVRVKVGKPDHEIPGNEPKISPFRTTATNVDFPCLFFSTESLWKHLTEPWLRRPLLEYSSLVIRKPNREMADTKQLVFSNFRTRQEVVCSRILCWSIPSPYARAKKLTVDTTFTGSRLSMSLDETLLLGIASSGFLSGRRQRFWQECCEPGSDLSGLKQLTVLTLVALYNNRYRDVIFPPQHKLNKWR